MPAGDRRAPSLRSLRGALARGHARVPRDHTAGRTAVDRRGLSRCAWGAAPVGVSRNDRTDASRPRARRDRPDLQRGCRRNEACREDGLHPEQTRRPSDRRRSRHRGIPRATVCPRAVGRGTEGRRGARVAWHPYGCRRAGDAAGRPRAGPGSCDGGAGVEPRAGARCPSGHDNPRGEECRARRDVSH